MNIQLAEFQEDAVDQLLKRLRQAKREVEEGDPQALILSAPTGSGKTVIITRLLEHIVDGTDEIAAEPDAVFLWLSDQLQLNKQSRKKIKTQSTRFRDKNLIVVTPDFNSERFHGGNIYFLNTQKLGRDKSLVTKTDFRQFTIWETINNTGRFLGSKFYLIIDEAHRGMNRTAREDNEAVTIAQRFIFGDTGVLDPVKNIIGISATPDRFKRLLEKAQSKLPRTSRIVEIAPEDVRASGLLKDSIILRHPKKQQPSDWTLLRAAAREWSDMRDAWAAYTTAQSLPDVKPILVVQVEDGTGKQVTRTDLAGVVDALEKELGPIDDNHLAHAFQEEGAIAAGSRIVRKLDASNIQEDENVKYVFFKMALTTGWDCPRAEVMMSFRRAQDDTLIAQLIGRMIRTPLVRRIEASEILNSVSLFLPHYDADTVSRVVERLRNDPDSLPVVEVEDGDDLQQLVPAANSSHALDALRRLPTYRLSKVRKQSNVRRLMRLSRLLTTIHGIDGDALSDTKQLIVGSLQRERQRLVSTSPEFALAISNAAEIEVRAVTVEQGTWKELPGSTERVQLSDRNIEDLFKRAGQRLGEGLELDYWQAEYSHDDPTRAKVELFLILQQQETWETLERVSFDRINVLFERHKSSVAALSSSDRELYNKIREVAKQPEAVPFSPPADMAVRTRDGETPWSKHLFVDSRGTFRTVLNGWERPTVEAFTSKDDVVGWLRNFERKPWSLLVPYEEAGEQKATYPDFLVVRRSGNRLAVDIVEPHRPDLADWWVKARGLAQYAKRHHFDVGRIELVRKAGNRLHTLNVADSKVYNKILSFVTSNAHLEQLFMEFGT
jgi:type III restriction enzyme